MGWILVPRKINQYKKFIKNRFVLPRKIKIKNGSFNSLNGIRRRVSFNFLPSCCKVKLDIQSPEPLTQFLTSKKHMEIKRSSKFKLTQPEHLNTVELPQFIEKYKKKIS